MTTATIAPVAPAATSPASTAPVITEDIRLRVNKIYDEQNEVIKGRADVLWGFWVARVAQQHLLMVGPGGTAKSMLQRDAVSHISDAVRFEVALDETTDPGQVFGPPDIPAMVKEGKNRRVIDGMFATSTDAFIDEFFNGNGPVLHSMMPCLNERIFHNNGMPIAVPLRSAVAGTNKLNADADQAALWDRLHIRYQVDYLESRQDQTDMISAAIARMSQFGRGTVTSLATTKTLVTLAELDQAREESLNLEVSDSLLDLYLDLKAKLKSEGVIVSDRRAVEGMAAVMATAWLRGHEEVKAGDLDILANMWWIVQDQAATVRQAVLEIANPGEKAALDLGKQFREIEATLNQAQSTNADPDRLRRVGVEVIRNADKLIREATEHKTKALAAGASVTRLNEVLDMTASFKRRVGTDIFNITPEAAERLQKA